MRLIFVRHGEPDYANDCLTENGRLQAQSTAERLQKEPLKAIYSSPMGRAVQTASYTAQKLGLEIHQLDFMHEINWGSADPQNPLEYEGHIWTLGYQLLAEHPEFVGSPDWKYHHFFRDNVCMEYYDRISNEIDSWLAQYGLVRKNGLYERQRYCDDTIALFAHGGSGAILFSHVLNLPLPFVLTTMPYGVCSVSVIFFDTQTDKLIVPRLELFNDMGHIENAKKERLHFEK